MLIKNADEMAETFSCGQLLGKWLHHDMNIPVLSIEEPRDYETETRYIFSNTDLLKEALSKKPFWIKLANIFVN
jgi:hypothetical protein